jgi:hypothetical protein
MFSGVQSWAQSQGIIPGGTGPGVAQRRTPSAGAPQPNANAAAAIKADGWGAPGRAANVIGGALFGGAGAAAAAGSPARGPAARAGSLAPGYQAPTASPAGAPAPWRPPVRSAGAAADTTPPPVMPSQTTQPQAESLWQASSRLASGASGALEAGASPIYNPRQIQDQQGDQPWVDEGRGIDFAKSGFANTDNNSPTTAPVPAAQGTHEDPSAFANNPETEDQLNAMRRSAFLGASDSLQGMRNVKSLLSRTAGLSEAENPNRYSVADLEQRARQALTMRNQPRDGVDSPTSVAFDGGTTLAPLALNSNNPEFSQTPFTPQVPRTDGADGRPPGETAQMPPLTAFNMGSTLQPNRQSIDDTFQGLSRAAGEKAFTSGEFQQPVDTRQKPLVLGSPADAGFNMQDALAAHAAQGVPYKLPEGIWNTIEQGGAGRALGARDPGSTGNPKLNASLGFVDPQGLPPLVAAAGPSMAGAPPGPAVDDEEWRRQWNQPSLIPQANTFFRSR